MKKTFVLLLICGIVFSLQAQSKRAKAQAQVVALKEGVLLVQLRNHQAYRDKLIAAGEAEKAAQNLAFEQSANALLQETFSKDFDFCPVYFFYSDQTEAIRNGNFESLLDSQLQKANLHDTERFKNIFYAGIRYVKYDTDFNLSEAEYIVLMDQDFNQLEHPFPISNDKGLSLIYRITWHNRAKKYGQFENWFFSEPSKSVAQVWDEKLSTYYNWLTHQQ